MLNRSIQVLISGCILWLGFPILGCFLGLMVYGYGLEPDKAWKKLGVPPVKIKGLLVAAKDTIYIQSANGRIFSCYRATQYDQECWNQVDTVCKMSDWCFWQCHSFFPSI